jgi:flagellar hook capping protein FlgD
MAAFGALVVATVAAFFITQHLKTSTPLLTGTPAPFPSVINPVSGVTCYQSSSRKFVNHRLMQVSFYLQNRSDTVDVYIVDSAGHVVATLATNRYMQGGSHPVRSLFVWDGREPSGSVAPDGRYYIKVRLIGARKRVTISSPSGSPEPVTVKTTPPRPIVTAVTPRAISRHRLTPVKIDYTGNEDRGATVVIYRIGRHGRLREVKTFLTAWAAQSTTWDGTVRRRPAPAGRYLIGLQVTDAACNTGSFPATGDPRLGTVSQAIVTVR